MQHLDEGRIHSWLDGALSADEAARVEAHVKECPQCAAAVAEARGFIAASTRILTALDNAPRGVIPANAPRRRFDPMVWRLAATVLVVAAGTLVVIRNRGGNEHQTPVFADRGALLEKRASSPERGPAATGPAQSTAGVGTPRVTATGAPAIATAKTTVAGDAGSGAPARKNEALKSRPTISVSQNGVASDYAGAAAPAASAFAPLRAAGVVAMDAASESAPLKVVGTPRRMGAKVTLYEIAPGDTVTLTEALPISLGEVVVTGATVVTGTAAERAAAQATVKSAGASAKARGAATAITTPADSQRAAASQFAPVVSAPAAPSQPGIGDPLRSISWTDPATGTTLTLTGRVPEARLREIKIRIERKRAAAPKKDP